MSLWSRVWKRICKEEMAGRSGRKDVGGSLSWGGGGQQTHPGEREEVKSVYLGQKRKGGRGGDGDETKTMSPCTDAERGVGGGEERELWPGQKAQRVRLFRKQHFGLRNPRAL